jgi:hypothetical protein
LVTIDKPLLRRLVVCIEIKLSEQIERFKPKDAETQAVALARVIGKGLSSLFETDEQDVPKT